MVNDIIESAPNQKMEIITLNGEKVYLKKNTFFKGYRVIYHFKDELGNKIWINILFGGWINLFKLSFILLIIVLAYLGYNEVYQQLINCQAGVNYLPKI